jgi:hypothetical protein
MRRKMDLSVLVAAVLSGSLGLFFRDQFDQSMRNCDSVTCLNSNRSYAELGLSLSVISLLIAAILLHRVIVFLLTTNNSYVRKVGTDLRIVVVILLGIIMIFGGMFVYSSSEGVILGIIRWEINGIFGLVLTVSGILFVVRAVIVDSHISAAA